jgi:hypothetical protein
MSQSRCGPFVPSATRSAQRHRCRNRSHESWHFCGAELPALRTRRTRRTAGCGMHSDVATDRCIVGCAWHGMAWHGMVWHGMCRILRSGRCAARAHVRVLTCSRRYKMAARKFLETSFEISNNYTEVRSCTVEDVATVVTACCNRRNRMLQPS